MSGGTTSCITGSESYQKSSQYIKHQAFNGKEVFEAKEDIPKVLLPSNSRVGTVSPIKVPAIAQCQGCLRNSSMINQVKSGNKMLRG
jgi:hypothetical protein